MKRRIDSFILIALAAMLAGCGGKTQRSWKTLEDCAEKNTELSMQVQTLESENTQLAEQVNTLSTLDAAARLEADIISRTAPNIATTALVMAPHAGGRAAARRDVVNRSNAATPSPRTHGVHDAFRSRVRMDRRLRGAGGTSIPRPHPACRFDG